MTNVEQLEQSLAAYGDDRDADALPAGFREKVEALRSAGPGSAQVAAERQSHLDAAARLIGQLGSADNGAVKMQKRRVARAELNAVRWLDSLGR